MNKKFLWVEEYRPHTLEDCILPKNIKESFQAFRDKGEIPNLLLAGTAGVGNGPTNITSIPIEINPAVISGSYK